jgi:hypothetical protein
MGNNTVIFHRITEGSINPTVFITFYLKHHTMLILCHEQFFIKTIGTVGTVGSTYCYWVNVFHHTNQYRWNRNISLGEIL